MPCTNPGSPRMIFQWRYVDDVIAKHPEEQPPSILNIGCASDPLDFADRAHHFDLDDWSMSHKRFTQGDAHALPYDDATWRLVMLGDIMEHVLDPEKVLSEACRVSKELVVLTIFEEWKLPGPGQWIEEGQQGSDIESRRLGYVDRLDYQKRVNPLTVTYDDTVLPHLIHINQFTDLDMFDLLKQAYWLGFVTETYIKAFEVKHEDHRIFNWLICLRRMEDV